MVDTLNPVTPVTNGAIVTTSNPLPVYIASGSAPTITVASTTIAGGTTTNILYDNAGVLGEYTISGTGTVVAMATGPTISAPTISGALTYGGVALAASVTGTGSMALSIAPIFTGTASFAAHKATAMSMIPAFNYAADAGSTDDYVANPSPAVILITGGIYFFKANTVNTGAATINFNSLGVKTIVKGVNTTLANADILAGMFCIVMYDGTNMVLMNPRAL